MPSATARPDPTRTATAPRSRVWRWVAVFVAVTLLHWLAAEWIERHRGVPPPARDVHVPVQVALLKPERVEREAQPAAKTAAPKAAPRPAHREAHAPHELRAVTPPKPHPEVAAAQPASSPATPDTAASDTAASRAAASAATGTGPNGGTAQAGAGNGNTPSAPATEASHGVKFSIPPSGELQYDTFYNGVRNQPGTIHWASDGQRYDMVVSVPLPFVGTFSWTSRGHVDAFGIAPDQYIEKRGHRPEDVTVFNRSEKQIVFTRTPNSLALPDGAQDRFSMVMQLASLVRGDPAAYQPGVTREFYVADNDSGEIWPVTTIGDETVSTDHGYVTARHFMRLPRHDGDKRRIDVWLAPSLGWLPVRLVQTEPNGSQFELVWRGPLTIPAANAAGNRSGTSGTNDAGETAAPGNNGSSEAPASAPAVEPASTPQSNEPAANAAEQPAATAPAAPAAPSGSDAAQPPATPPSEPPPAPAASPAPPPTGSAPTNDTPAQP
ncbi:DUF3108 domain-containing protein [Paraburkholderia ferrariae]|uniref:DUF3108 domain-containing protein n=1 Tax=Paraburkholderia ferrariae TaxID=386056 RepID=UPI0007C7405D|nr:DUF3108 domain-containing protein [Paraburkholderia ferrariae]